MVAVQNNKDISELMKLQAPRSFYEETDAADDEKLGGMSRSVTRYNVEQGDTARHLAGRINTIAESIPEELRVAPTPELARAAASTLVDALRKDPDSMTADTALEIVRGIIAGRPTQSSIATGMEVGSPDYNEFKQMTRFGKNAGRFID